MNAYLDLDVSTAAEEDWMFDLAFAQDQERYAFSVQPMTPCGNLACSNSSYALYCSESCRVAVEGEEDTYAASPQNAPNGVHRSANFATSPPGAPSDTPDAPTALLEGKNEEFQPSLSETLRRGLVFIKNKPFIRHSALVAEAHARGLLKLEVTFISVTSDLALAQATVIFASGLVVTDVADSTPGNVGVQVKAHWIRLAATRAAARALRNALAVEMCSLEELGAES